MEGKFFFYCRTLLMLYVFSFQANHLQSRLSTITVMIDGNASYTEIGKQHFLAGMELYKKEDELLSLVKEKKSLEDDFAAFKTLVGRERNDWQADDKHKSVVLASLEMNLKVPALSLSSIAFESSKFPLYWTSPFDPDFAPGHYFG